MIVGEDVTVVSSRDPGLRGRSGKVLLETANTLLLDTPGRRSTVPKAGSAFSLNSTGSVLTGDELKGRLEDRLGARKR
jgi:RNase P/RNase MRP subunit p29